MSAAIIMAPAKYSAVLSFGFIHDLLEENYYATWKYKDAYYQLSGQIEKEELIKILNEMQYNV